jgi:tRNA-2-methylthio-N6-dimethylallyladenosine synthase
MRRIDWMKSARRPIAISTDIIVGFPGETWQDFEATLDLLEQVEYDSVFSFKYSRRPNTAALALDDQIAEEEKTRRLAIVQERQRAIQVRRNAAYLGAVEECLVEGFNKATGQWIGRTSQNKTLNFLEPAALGQGTANSETLDQGTPNYRTNPTELSLLGQYVAVRVTRAGPNSLAGEYEP